METIWNSNKWLWVAGIILVLAAVVFIGKFANNSDSILGQSAPKEKVYVALEGDGAVAVIDAQSDNLIKTISLTDERTGTMYMAHNVQVSSDGGTVWVTANAMAGMGEQSFRFIPIAYANEGHEDTETMSDQVIAIDPQNDEIIRRIPIGTNQHLAHVVTSQDGSTVFTAAQETDKVYVVDAGSMTLGRTIDLPAGSGPHGMRLSPDGKTLYAAFMGGKALGIIDVESGKVVQKELDGAAVQTAVAPNGSWAAVSVYDSRSVAVYDPSKEALSYVRLPEGSQGPVQLYPTPDSRFVYVADQGVLNDREANDKLYKIDISSLAVVETIEAGKAPHGVALSQSGTRAYATNLKGDSVSIIDTVSGKELREIKVGKEPNGISVWSGKESQTTAGSLQGAAITMYKSPTCGCCGNYAAELKRQGANVTIEQISDAELAAKKQELGVRSDLQSCHTSVMDGYVIEGHVPMEAVAKLRSEHPDIAGIALPGMPAGSPGMSGVKSSPFAVKTLAGDMFGSF